jgi:diadenylate cyclase
LTEENDAVAVVVSEETGRISIATEGQMSRGFTAETLRARLTQLVLQRKSARRTRPFP